MGHDLLVNTIQHLKPHLGDETTSEGVGLH